MDNKNKKYDGSLKKNTFRKLHERVQNKYNAMLQKMDRSRLDKSKSTGSLTTISDNYDFKSDTYSSHGDLRMVLEENADVQSVNSNMSTLSRGCSYVEEIVSNGHLNALSREIVVQEIMCDTIEPDTVTGTPRVSEESLKENQNYFFPEYFTNSCESLNKIAEEKLHEETIQTPSPKISIRDKIGSRISAVKEKRRREDKEKTANKDKKKESREKVEKYLLTNTTKQDVVKKKQKVATVTVAVIEATGSELESTTDDKRIFSSRLRLGSEKRKSKAVKSCSSIASFQELFNLNLYDENMLEISVWEKDSFIGRALIDISELEQEKTHRKKLDLVEGIAKSVQIFILLTINGTSISNTFTDFDDYHTKVDNVAKKFAWYRLSDDCKTVGWLTVIVYGAKGLSGNDCYCILEIGNDRLQTLTENKTCCPNWMKILNFPISDITSILEVTVHDEKKSEDMGKVLIPLLRIKNQEKKWYALKEPSLKERAKGNNPRILLEMRFAWNLVKASVRVVNTREVKYLKTETKFDRQILTRNWSRTKAILSWTYGAFKVFKTCFEWESRKTNAMALGIWLIFCWFFKVWMLPLLLLIPFVWYRNEKYHIFSWKQHILKTYEVIEAVEEKEEKNTSLRQKLISLQELIQTVQNEIGNFANLGESIKNLFNFTVPFLSLLAIFFISTISFIMYLIPTKYIFMCWGIHKFTRKILRPNRIPNNEILDLLSRVPNDDTLNECEEFPLEELSEDDEKCK